MSIEHSIRQEVSHDEQTVEDFEGADGPELRGSVEQEIQGKVDTNHHEAAGRGLTLVAEEKQQAREMELGRTRGRWDRRQDSDREARTRDVAEEGSRERGRMFEKRAASVDQWRDPDVVDPRAEMGREELAGVNKQAVRIKERLKGGPTTAAISRRLAERVGRGADLVDASVEMMEAEWMSEGAVVPIDRIEDVPRGEVSISGTVEVLWEPRHPSISQVGLIADDTGRTKFTTWVRSDAPMVREGDEVVLRDVAKSWYEGRCSVALTGWSEIRFEERGQWW
ncbi:DNA-binding protein [Haloarcula marina]|uniref:DNA-binding protein n=1 Tax=Haloarcula marina TaxID=2961574 RepID=UPI0020B82470|nr:DNA-binding protein [Halomicroarcula marina]